MKKISFQSCRLYVIVDGAVLNGQNPVSVAEAAIRGGADAIQWRDKTSSDSQFLETARALRKVTERGRAIFIVNDRLEAGLLSGADGVHLGHEDLSIKEARALAGDGLLIGRSTHSLAEALEAEQAGADYIGVGPVFATPTKPDYPAVGIELIRQVADSPIRIPWVAIGGIDHQTLALVLSAGATRVAVVRAVAGASDPQQSARSLKAGILENRIAGRTSR